MAANMYRVGDYVYFENSSSNPYQIRRIEELTKTPNGNVEAKCVCFYRRRDISSSLISLADKHATALEEERDDAEFDNLAEVDRHQLKHKELFLSRQLESLPATHIRGKCSVTLLNETESLQSYLNKEDSFFYTLVYDPVQKTLLADKGEIRVGSRYQAEVPPILKEDETDGRELAKMESKIWDPENPLEDRQIDQFMVIARSVGTFARALDCSSSVRQPSLHMSAAAASRDITLFHAMNTLHKTQYDATKAITSLVPQGGPVLCRDEMEEWSASEANLFEEALEKYGKDFNDIRQDFLPWKSLNSIIEYYYMWKTTDRYVQQKRLKAAEAESKLKQVYIPNYNKPNPNQITNKPGTPNSLMNGQGEKPTRACEGCYATNSHQWYSWGPPNMQCRLCSVCWSYWKKMGGLKMPTRLGEKLGEAEGANDFDGGRPSPTVQIEPTYPCRICGKVFYRQERLAGHMPMHRPFRCTIRDCGKEFKLKAHLARHCATAHGLTIRQSNSPKFTVKTRQAFFLCATPLTRLSRRLCKDILKPRHAARVPFDPVNIASIKIECQTRMPEDPQKVLKKRKRTRPDLSKILGKLGIEVEADSPEWMNGCSIPPEPILGKPPRTIASCTDRKEYKSMFPDHPVREPKPNAERNSGGDEKPGSVPSNPTTILNNVSPPIMKKRPYDQMNGMDGPAAKRSLPMGGPNDMPMKKGDASSQPTPVSWGWGRPSPPAAAWQWGASAPHTWEWGEPAELWEPPLDVREWGKSTPDDREWGAERPWQQTPWGPRGDQSQWQQQAVRQDPGHQQASQETAHQLD
ncbi:metastasis-associated protein MTA3-like isoform X4 [Branchiostoma lanceolatum]|uniref:metastasis-associated protein MTA3-like isoform X4 n=1 Tax=Branchiostoma lanceolatum TaxID=7740 RepID=UPI0034525666